MSASQKTCLCAFPPFSHLYHFSFPDGAKFISSHQVTQTVLDLPKFTIQNFQILTSLSCSPNFDFPFIFSRKIMNTFLSSGSQDKVVPYSIKLIGALGSHPK
jgi:hypothetical protein